MGKGKNKNGKRLGTPQDSPTGNRKVHKPDDQGDSFVTDLTSPPDSGDEMETETKKNGYV